MLNGSGTVTAAGLHFYGSPFYASVVLDAPPGPPPPRRRRRHSHRCHSHRCHSSRETLLIAFEPIEQRERVVSTVVQKTERVGDERVVVQARHLPTTPHSRNVFVSNANCKKGTANRAPEGCAAKSPQTRPTRARQAQQRQIRTHARLDFFVSRQTRGVFFVKSVNEKASVKLLVPRRRRTEPACRDGGSRRGRRSWRPTSPCSTVCASALRDRTASRSPNAPSSLGAKNRSASASRARGPGSNDASNAADAASSAPGGRGREGASGTRGRTRMSVGTGAASDARLLHGKRDDR